MRALIWIAALAAALWAGWWVVGSRAARQGAEAAFAAAPAAGWQASNAGIAVAGFPNRFDLTLTAPAVGRDGWGWRGDFLQVLAMAWKPNHLILALPPTQALTTPWGEVPLTAEGMQASLVLDPATRALDRLALVGEGVALGAGRAGTLRLALRRVPGADAGARYEIGAEALDFALPPALRPAVLPPAGARAFVDGFATLSAPLDAAAAAAPPAVLRLEIARADVAWGGLTVAASGTLAPDAEGRAEGSLSLTLSDPAAAGAVLAAAGLLPPGAVPPAAVSLAFAEGRVRLGPFDLGPAPRLAGP